MEVFGDLLTTDYASIVEEDAAEKIMELERQTALPRAIKVIKKFIVEEQILASDIRALLDDTERSAPFTAMNLYSHEPKRHVLAIVTLLRAVSSYVQMEERTPHVYSVFCEFREIVRINRLMGKFQDVVKSNVDETESERRVRLGHSIPKYIDPVIYDGIYLMPPEIEIIDVYRKLYSPTFASEWEELMKIEGQIFKLVEYRSDKLGGRHRRPKAKDDCPVRIDISLLRQKVYQLCKNSCIIVGTWAIGEGGGSSASKLQLISSRNIEEDLEQIREHLKQFTQFGIKYHPHDMRLPNDFRLRRNTVLIQYPHCSGKMREKPLLDIFNAAQFDLIPHIGRNGHPWVLLRFAFIDLFIIRMIWKLGYTDAATKDKHFSSTLNLIYTVKETFKGKMPPLPIDFYGYEDDDILAAKRKRLIYIREHRLRAPSRSPTKN